jgi:hypothetical protein
MNKLGGQKMAENTQETNGTQEVVDMSQMLRMANNLIEAQQKQIDQLMAMVQNGTKTNGGNGRGGRHTPIHTLDTKTNKVYRTQAEAGIAVAPEFGLKIHNFVWYELVKGTKNNPAKCPDRFKTIDEDEYQRRMNQQNQQTAPKAETKVEHKTQQPASKK